ncbi:TPA: type II secretion system F family protein [Candidatus Berkelbacteria bacterium]|uniref:Type II secretory pathway, component PulF n=1 Tax=Berkelbacteria bacterium GW2011_GWE1_39_12 TaxID=1618337 RepID=A0A0G4B3R6_9BACT|nr:MAG: type II secretory pathway, component PulF [Berkelbacteria bacterium GW2011_GWE1_39_12]HBO60648.1 type II secretion system F family protein [Candidatus Berkelbacteria bacterium]
MDFNYVVKNQKGEEEKGEIVAANEKQALELLKQRDVIVVEITAKKNYVSNFNFKKKVSLKDKIIFTKQLAVMVKGGLPLIEALEALKIQTENKEFSQVITDITNDVRGGMALSKAFGKHPKVFPQLYVSITASGERSGKLDEVLNRLASQLQNDYDLITKVKSAMTYPIVIVSALFGVVLLMLIFVVPKMKTIFDEMGVPLPLPTRVLLNISAFTVHYWYAVIFAVAIIIVLVRIWSKTSNGGIVLDQVKIRFPIFGALTKKIYLARFARTTATLVASGLPMLEIIETDKAVVGNKVYLPIFDTISNDVESGIPLSKALAKQKIFPIMISQMISVGEKSGKIDEILSQLADFYDKEVEATTASMASLIEPILIIIIGIGMGVAIIAVIMPIYSMVNVI